MHGQQLVFLINFYQTSRVGPARLSLHSDPGKFEDNKASIDIWQLLDANSRDWAHADSQSTVFERPLPNKSNKLRIQSVYLVPGDVLVVPAFWWVTTEAPKQSLSVEVQAEGHFMARSLHAVLRNNVWLNLVSAS